MHSLVSIIVPVYNAEKTICRCIDSIINQTYIYWELILINDGSNDNSGKICDKYSKKDKRIKVFHKENGGVSSARNVGLDNAKGEWITFVDSDDWVKSEYIANLLSHFDEGIDLVVSYAEIFFIEYTQKEYYNSKTISFGNFEEMFIDNDMHWHTSPWSKLYKKSIIEKNHLRFCEGMHIGEDAVFLYSYILKSRLIYISSDTDYCYYSEIENSLTKRVNTLDSELLSYEKINEIVNDIISVRVIKNVKALSNLYWIIAVYLRRILNALYHNKINRRIRIKVLRTIKWDFYIENINANSFKEKILIQILKYKFYVVYDFIRFMSVKFHYIKN